MPASTPAAIPAQLDPSQFHSEFGYFAPTIGFRRKIALTIKAAALGTFLGAAAMFVMVMDREEKAVTMLAAPMVSTPSQTAMAHKAEAAQKPGAVLFLPQSMALPSAAARRSQARGVMAAVAAPAAEPVTPEPPAVVAMASASAVATPSQAAAAHKSGAVLFVPQSIAFTVAAPSGSQAPGVVAASVPPAAEPVTPEPAAVAVTPEPAAAAATASAATVAVPLPAPAAITPSSEPEAVTPPAAPVVAAAPVHAPVKVVAKPKKKIVREPRRERVVVIEPEPPQSFAGPFRRFAEPSYGRPLFGFGR